jgi:hypothetical protein
MKEAGTVWIVVEDGKPDAEGIRCEGGKELAKSRRKDLERETGKKWKAKKVNRSELLVST